MKWITAVMSLVCLGTLALLRVARGQSTGSIVGWGQIVLPEPSAFEGLVAVDGGEYYTMGLKASGTIVAWGNNAYGQCNVPAPNADFVAISAGIAHSLGVKVAGRSQRGG